MLLLSLLWRIATGRANCLPEREQTGTLYNSESTIRDVHVKCFQSDKHEKDDYDPHCL